MQILYGRSMEYGQYYQNKNMTPTLSAGYMYTRQMWRFKDQDTCKRWVADVLPLSRTVSLLYSKLNRRLYSKIRYSRYNILSDLKYKKIQHSRYKFLSDLKYKKATCWPSSSVLLRLLSTTVHLHKNIWQFKSAGSSLWVRSWDQLSTSSLL